MIHARRIRHGLLLYFMEIPNKSLEICFLMSFSRRTQESSPYVRSFNTLELIIHWKYKFERRPFLKGILNLWRFSPLRSVIYCTGCVTWIHRWAYISVFYCCNLWSSFISFNSNEFWIRKYCLIYQTFYWRGSFHHILLIDNQYQWSFRILIESA